MEGIEVKETKKVLEETAVEVLRAVGETGKPSITFLNVEVWHRRPGELLRNRDQG